MDDWYARQLLKCMPPDAQYFRTVRKLKIGVNISGSVDRGQISDLDVRANLLALRSSAELQEA